MDFKTADAIKLKPADTNYNAQFKFPIATNTTSNDGSIPSNTVINSVSVTGTYNNSAIDDLITGVPTISGTDTVQVSLNYPTTTMSGITRAVNMSLEFVLTLDDSSTKQFDFDNIKVLL